MSARVPPPLVGFNNNVRYRGMSFHIQTEDSGVARPRITTHLFVDGGHIIRTLRTDYSEHVNSPDCRALVQRLMREQHRAMAQELKKGRMDAVIDGLKLKSAPTRSDDVGRSEPEPAAPAEAKPKRRKTPRSRTAVRSEKNLRAVSAPNTEAVPSPGGSPDVRVEPEATSIFGLPRDSLDELILGYIARAVE